MKASKSEEIRDRSAPTGLLDQMTTGQWKDFNPEVVVILVGSTEPHGPHLPYGTDTYIVSGITEEAVRLANARQARVLRLPPLPISNNVNFKEFRFACRIRVETLMAVLMDMVTALTEEGIRKIVIVNGHGGNIGTLQAFLRQVYDQFQQKVFVCAFEAGHFGADTYQSLFTDGSLHAGDYETSLMLHLAPELVVREACEPAPMSRPCLSALSRPGLDWVRGWHLLMPKSCSGRPDEATPEKGARIFEAATAGMAQFLVELSQEPWHPRFPYPKGEDNIASE